MREIHSNSPAETEAAGQAIAGLLQPGEIVAYRGGLGMGKTTFTRGTCPRTGLRGRGVQPDLHPHQ